MSILGLRWISLLPFFLLAWLGLRSFTTWSSNYYRLMLSVPLGTALLVLLTALVGRWAHSLPTALWLSSGIAAAGCIPLLLKYKGGSGSWKLRGIPFLITAGFLTLLSTYLVSQLALNFSFHDQMRIQAHPPLIESLKRGNLPPTMMVFPDIPLKYHWGADLFGAVMSYVTGLPAYRAIDITMIFGWISWLGSLYVFCREAAMSRNFALIALLWVTLGAGWAYLIQSHLAGPESLIHLNFDWPDSKRAFGRHLNPGTISNFFMTPYSLGMGLFFTYLALLTHWIKERRRSLLALISILLAGISLVQVTFFVTLLTTTLLILAAGPFLEKRPWRDCLVDGFLLLSISLPLAVLVGGFFQKAAGITSGLLVFNWPPGFLKNATWGAHIPMSLTQTFFWYLATFGSLVFLSLPFLGLALYSLRRRYNPILLFLVAYAVTCFLVPQFFRYKMTWDIIKWFTGFQIAMVLVIVMLWSDWKKKTALVSLALGALMVLDMVPSLRFLGSLALLQPKQVEAKKREWWTVVIRDPSPTLQSIVDKLQAGDWKNMVLTTDRLAPTLAAHTGQSMAPIDINTIYFGVHPLWIQKRKVAIENLKTNFNPGLMRRYGIPWLVFPCGDFEVFFTPASKLALKHAVGRGELTPWSPSPSEECWKIYHLPEITPATSPR